MSQTQIACQTFQNQFAEILKQVQGLDDGFTEFMGTASRLDLESLQNGIDGHYKIKSEFMTQFQDQARELVETWLKQHYVPYILDSYLGKVKFEDSGRVVFGDHILATHSGKKFSYFPSIIRKLEGTLVLEDTNITMIDELEEVGGTISADGAPIRSMKRLKRIGGGASFEHSKIANLEALEEAGNLTLEECQNITSLPNLKSVEESLNIKYSPIKSLDALQKVGGALRLMVNPDIFTGAAKLQTIGKELSLGASLRSGFRQAFPALESIGEDSTGSSVHIVSALNHIAEEIQKLRRENKLHFTGNIRRV